MSIGVECGPSALAACHSFSYGFREKRLHGWTQVLAKLLGMLWSSHTWHRSTNNCNVNLDHGPDIDWHAVEERVLRRREYFDGVESNDASSNQTDSEADKINLPGYARESTNAKYYEQNNLISSAAFDVAECPDWK